jgi:hypothetical protein
VGERGDLKEGLRVEVKSRFDGHWARGFEVDTVEEGGVRVRRVSDGSVLPVLFTLDEVQPERHRQGLWWYR